MTLLAIVSCSNDNSAEPQGQFVVDKIFDYNNNLLAEYIYSSENQLIKRITTDPINQRSSDEYIERFYDYEYDGGIQPNFGINNIFQFEPLPYFGTEAMFEKNISLNNMTKNVTSGTKWIYEYNHNNLPETIETKWDGIETEEPMLLRIEYKEIE